VGPSFRGLTIDDTGEPDPRVELAENPSQAFDSSQDLFAPLKVESPSSPLTIASGDEAQLIVAEVEGGNRAVEIINNVRDRNGIDVEWQPSGSSENEIRNKTIEERKRTLFLEGVRLGDHRRYLEKFGLDTFQQSTPQGFEVGDQTCLPVPNIESSNNPAF